MSASSITIAQSSLANTKKIPVLTYNVLYSTALDENGPQKNITERTEDDGSTELHLVHKIEKYHRYDFNKDFPNGKYNDTIPLRLLNDVRRAIREDDKESLEENVDNSSCAGNNSLENDVVKMKKYYRIYEESIRYSLLETRLEGEIVKSAADNGQNSDFYRPIICLTEVSRKWSRD